MLTLWNGQIGAFDQCGQYSGIFTNKPPLSTPQRCMYRWIHVNDTRCQWRYVIWFSNFRDTPAKEMRIERWEWAMKLRISDISHFKKSFCCFSSHSLKNHIEYVELKKSESLFPCDLDYYIRLVWFRKNSLSPNTQAIPECSSLKNWTNKPKFKAKKIRRVL